MPELNDAGFLMDDFVVVFYSRFRKTLVVYTNLSPRVRYGETPMLDMEFTAALYVAVDRYLDYCIGQLGLTAHSRTDGLIVRLSLNLKQHCRDYS